MVMGMAIAAVTLRPGQAHCISRGVARRVIGYLLGAIVALLSCALLDVRLAHAEQPRWEFFGRIDKADQAALAAGRLRSAGTAVELEDLIAALAKQLARDYPDEDWQERLADWAQNLPAAEGEQEVDRVLKEGYQQALQGSKDADKNEALLAVALRHWVVLLRRAIGGSLHTEVPELNNDNDCRGDIISDRLLAAYFEAIDPVIAAPDVARAASALAALARQGACLSARQNAFLAAAYARTFADLRAFLRSSGLRPRSSTMSPPAGLSRCS